MKTCSQCGKTYGDEMLFCLDDGTALLDPHALTEEVTVRLPAKAGRSGSMLFAITGFTLLLLALVTVPIGGFIYYSTRPETAIANSNAEETPAQGPTPESMDQYYATPSPEPTTAKTPNEVAKETPPKIPTPEPNDVAEPKSPPAKPFQISGGILNGKATSLPQPVYPPAARAVHASGQVIVQVSIDTAGNVVSARALRGHPLLRQSAVRGPHGRQSFHQRSLQANLSRLKACSDTISDRNALVHYSASIKRGKIFKLTAASLIVL